MTKEEIKHQNKLIALILRANHVSDKVEFFSPPDFSQQVGFLPHKKGNVIQAHFHKEVHRRITMTQEVLFIRKGRILVNFYAVDRAFITSRELEAGDVLFLCAGGHGFKMLEDTEMIEIKQGPYSGKDSDKVRFEGRENDSGK